MTPATTAPAPGATTPGTGVPPFSRRRTGALYDILRGPPATPQGGTTPAPPSTADDQKKNEDEELVKKIRGIKNP